MISACSFKEQSQSLLNIILEYVFTLSVRESSIVCLILMVIMTLALLLPLRGGRAICSHILVPLRLLSSLYR
jgi:hypothetical protein